MNNLLKISVLALIMAALLYAGCGSGDGQNATNDKKTGPGDKTTCTADGVSFTMAYVPGGITFPSDDGGGGPDYDDSTATVTNAYWAGDTEVTYELWSTVYIWATSGTGDPGAGEYSFANPGIQGSDGDQTDQHPVTFVNWRDSMVFCNAITEWYNAQNGTSYTCVYKDEGTPIRDSTDDNAAQCDEVTPDSTADGFRLLASMEWELAARYITDDGDNTLDKTGEYYPGNYASGADNVYNQTASSDYDGDGDTESTGDVSWYWENSDPDNDSTKSTQIVGTAGNYGGVTLSGNANALGLYDMSGNVDEWCFDWHPVWVGTIRVERGGSWGSSADGLQVGVLGTIGSPSSENIYLGLRLARTAE